VLAGEVHAVTQRMLHVRQHPSALIAEWSTNDHTGELVACPAVAQLTGAGHGDPCQRAHRAIEGCEHRFVDHRWLGVAAE
jgi:hypothetical protein